LTASSSNRQAGLCDALVMQIDRQVGVMRLPENRQDDFVDHFNLKYQSLGIKIVPIIPSEAETKNPHQQQG